MFKRRLLIASALIGATLAPAAASAAALTDKAVPGIFTNRSTQAFKFWMSTSPNTIFYVPKSGGVRVDGDISNPAPEFAASTIIGTWTPFLNKPLTSIGGTLTSANHLGDYKQMTLDAKAAGYVMAPAPVQAASTRVALIGIPGTDGVVHTRCITQTYNVQDTDDEGNPAVNPDGSPKMIKLEVPACYITDPRDSTKEIRSDIFIDYNSLDSVTSDVEADYGFQGVIHPANAGLVKSKLRSGARWDDLIKVDIDWTMTQEQTPRYAEIEVNWKSVFQQLWAKAAFHNFACIDVQVEAMIRDVAVCAGQPAGACGVKVHWYDDNGNELPPGVIPPGADFGELVNGAVAKIENELAQTIVPKLGDPGDVANDKAVFVFKGNFQKISVERHETIPLYYFPKAKTVKASTMMSIGCLKGDVDQLINWNVTNPACKAMLSETTVGSNGQGN
jgi:hypothetical protein